MAKELFYKSIGEIVLTDRVTAVLSEAYPDSACKGLKGYFLNKRLTTEKYTGPTPGIFIPEDILIEFLKIFPKEYLISASEE